MYNRPWTNEEEQFLINNWQSLSNKELGLKLNRPQRAIQHKMVRLNLSRRHRLNDDIKKEIIRSYLEDDLLPQEIANNVGFYYKTVLSVLNEAGVNKARDNINKAVRQAKWKGYGDVSGRYWYTIQAGAKIRNIEILVTIEDIWNLYVEQDGKCKLSGVPIFLAKYSNNEAIKQQTASLDRKDSTKGYIKDNIQWIHKSINTMKMDMSDNELIEWCRLISKNNP